eukprot:241951_1
MAGALLEGQKLFKNIKYEPKLKKVGMEIVVPNTYNFKYLATCNVLPFYQPASFIGLLFMGAVHVSTLIWGYPIFVIKDFKYTLFVVCASHPQYMEYVVSYDQIGGTCYFYSDKNKSHLIAKSSFKLSRSKDKQIRVQLPKDKINANKSNKIENIVFALPHMVGLNSKRYVLLSDLMFNHKNKEIFSSAKLTTSMFKNNPLVVGSGDHINTAHVHQLLHQFCHLIVRNSDNNNEFSEIYKELGYSDVERKAINKESEIILFDSEVKFLKPIRLGAFEIILKSIHRVKTSQYNLKDNYKLLSSYNTDIAFYVDFVIRQYDVDCCCGKVGACSLFLKSLL